MRPSSKATTTRKKTLEVLSSLQSITTLLQKWRLSRSKPNPRQSNTSSLPKTCTTVTLTMEPSRLSSQSGSHHQTQSIATRFVSSLWTIRQPLLSSSKIRQQVNFLAVSLETLVTLHLYLDHRTKMAKTSSQIWMLLELCLECLLDKLLSQQQWMDSRRSSSPRRRKTGSIHRSSLCMVLMDIFILTTCIWNSTRRWAAFSQSKNPKSGLQHALTTRRSLIRCSTTSIQALTIFWSKRRKKWSSPKSQHPKDFRSASQILDFKWVED